jgi:hypothetical protein
MMQDPLFASSYSEDFRGREDIPAGTMSPVNSRRSETSPSIREARAGM